jgi:hypothetical protein
MPVVRVVRESVVLLSPEVPLTPVAARRTFNGLLQRREVPYGHT